MRITTDRTYDFAAPPGSVWAALEAVETYPTWWPWLRRFDGRALAPGEAWRCMIRPPLPYAIRCTLTLVDVRAGALVVATLAGDIAGDARVELAPADPAAGPGPAERTRVRVASHLEARSRAARLASRWLPAVARWGHDWVFDTAARQFGAATAGATAAGGVAAAGDEPA